MSRKRLNIKKRREVKVVIKHFQIGGNDGIQQVPAAESNWLVLDNPSETERKNLIEKYNLPAEIFVGARAAEEVSHFDALEETSLTNAYVLVLTNLSEKKAEKIEDRLKPIIFILSDSLLITYFGNKSSFLDHLLQKYKDKITTFEGLITYSVFMLYNHYIQELLAIKKDIDALDQAARKTTENKELFKLADTNRKVVYIDHTLAGQKSTLDSLWQKEQFIEKLNNPKVLYDIRLHQKHAEELIKIYRDLLETVGGLFSDMMDNNLNHLMKYLDSAALIISIPALISGIWGMNTGGLPGKGSNTGFFLVVGASIILAIVFGIHLKRKDFSK